MVQLFCSFISRLFILHLKYLQWPWIRTARIWQKLPKVCLVKRVNLGLTKKFLNQQWQSVIFWASLLEYQTCFGRFCNKFNGLFNPHIGWYSGWRVEPVPNLRSVLKYIDPVLRVRCQAAYYVNYHKCISSSFNVYNTLLKLRLMANFELPERLVTTLLPVLFK